MFLGRHILVHFLIQIGSILWFYSVNFPPLFLGYIDNDKNMYYSLSRTLTPHNRILSTLKNDSPLRKDFLMCSEHASVRQSLYKWNKEKDFKYLSTCILIYNICARIVTTKKNLSSLGCCALGWARRESSPSLWVCQL